MNRSSTFPEAPRIASQRLMEGQVGASWVGRRRRVGQRPLWRILWSPSASLGQADRSPHLKGEHVDRIFLLSLQGPPRRERVVALLDVRPGVGHGTPAAGAPARGGSAYPIGPRGLIGRLGSSG